MAEDKRKGGYCHNSKAPDKFCPHKGNSEDPLCRDNRKFQCPGYGGK